MSKKHLILLPGWVHNFQNNTEFISYLERDFIVHTISYPGYADTPESKSAQSLSSLAEMINTYAMEKSLKTFIIVGFSFGTQVTLKYIDQYNPKQRAVLIGPSFKSYHDRAKPYMITLANSKLLTDLIRLVRPIKYALVNFAYHSAQQLTPESKAEDFKEVNTTLNGAFDTIVAVMRDYTSPQKYTNNTNVIYGEYDALKETADQVEARYQTIEGVGHYPFADKPKETAELIKSLL